MSGARLAWHLVAWPARLLVAGLFVYAAVKKIADPAAFAADIRGYELFRVALTNAMAYTVPWIELSTAVLLVAGLWRGEARWLIGLMLVAFTVLKVVALELGHALDCGCFGDSLLGRLSVGWYGVYLNLVLLAALGVDGLAAWRLRAGRRPAAATHETRPELATTTAG